MHKRLRWSEKAIRGRLSGCHGLDCFPYGHHAWHCLLLSFPASSDPNCQSSFREFVSVTVPTSTSSAGNKNFTIIHDSKVLLSCWFTPTTISPAAQYVTKQSDMSIRKYCTVWFTTYCTRTVNAAYRGKAKSTRASSLLSTFFLPCTALTLASAKLHDSVIARRSSYFL